MANTVVVSLTTGPEDAEKVTVAFQAAVGAAEQGRDCLMFLTEEAARLALDGVATGQACEPCPPPGTLTERSVAAGGRYLVCPICVEAKSLDEGGLVPGAELSGTVPMWAWIGDDDVVTFSY